MSACVVCRYQGVKVTMNPEVCSEHFFPNQVVHRCYACNANRVGHTEVVVFLRDHFDICLKRDFGVVVWTSDCPACKPRATKRTWWPFYLPDRTIFN